MCCVRSLRFHVSVLRYLCSWWAGSTWYGEDPASGSLVRIATKRWGLWVTRYIPRFDIGESSNSPRLGVPLTWQGFSRGVSCSSDPEQSLTRSFLIPLRRLFGFKHILYRAAISSLLLSFITEPTCAIARGNAVWCAWSVAVVGVLLAVLCERKASTSSIQMHARKTSSVPQMR